MFLEAIPDQPAVPLRLGKGCQEPLTLDQCLDRRAAPPQGELGVSPDRSCFGLIGIRQVRGQGVQ
jgi:hypothetical protein